MSNSSSASSFPRPNDIIQFLELTGASQDDALTYLTIANHDLTRAVEHYFGNTQGGGLSPLSGTKEGYDNQQYHDSYMDNIDSTSYGSSSVSNRRINGGNKKDTKRYQNKDVDEFVDEEGYRKPLPTKKMKLINDEMISPLPIPHGYIHQQVDLRSPAKQRQLKLPYAYERAVSPKTKSKAAPIVQAKKLKTLFQPPQRIMWHGSFDEAKKFSISQNKWLLVNIQQEDEFLCHQLNRDVWNNETIQDMISCSFVFWQQQRQSRSGQEYDQLYNVLHCPHIAVIDPRTGVLRFKLEQCADPEKISERIQDFVERAPVPGADDIRGSATVKSVPVEAAGHYDLVSASRTSISASESTNESKATRAGGKSAVVDLLSDSDKDSDNGSETLVSTAQTSESQSSLTDSSSKSSVPAQTSNNNLLLPHADTKVIDATSEKVDIVQERKGFSALQVIAAGERTNYMTQGGPIVKIQFRFPSGRRAIQSFPVSATLHELIYFAGNELNKANLEQLSKGLSAISGNSGSNSVSFGPSSTLTSTASSTNSKKEAAQDSLSNDIRFDITAPLSTNSFSALDADTTLEQLGMIRDTALLVHKL